MRPSCVGPQRGPWENHDGKGWCGDEPPFHTPVFVLTHHVRPSLTLSDTTFHILDAGLIDTMNVAVSPIELERGERLWTSPEELTERFHLEVIPSPSGVTHHLFWRR